MSIELRIVSSIAVLVALIALIMMLRRIGMLHEDHGKLFSSLITNVTLPALVFYSLSRTQILASEAHLAAIMMGAGALCLVAGWGVARALRLEGPQKGPVILVCGFGSSSLLGIALVAETFPGNDAAVGEAIILSALGVQPMLFTVGTMIAQFHGGAAAAPKERLRQAARYFHSPIFIAFAAGIAVSLLAGDTVRAVHLSVMDGFHMVASANTFLVAMTVGLFLHLQLERTLIAVAASVAMVKLVLMPALAWLPTILMDLPLWQVEVLVLEAAMPSATLAVVFSHAYGCDTRFAAKLVLATTILSIVTAPVMIALLT